MKMLLLRFLTFCCAASAISSTADAVAPLSQYGQIQNVQNYSSNPFWSPGSQYNKRIAPSPVYTTGPDVETADCQTIVTSLIAVQCAAQNNCTNMRVSDIRPAIMTGLARLPGHNYASSCAGYIDSAFESYTAQYTNTVQPSAFPATTGAAPAAQQNEFKIKNPYEIKKPAWAEGVKERATELQQLQSQDAPTAGIQAEAFPTTINDVAFTDRMQNLAAGYAPYKDASAYNGLDVESQEEAWTRRVNIMELQRQQDRNTLSTQEYCDKYLDPKKCNQTKADIDAVIAHGYAQSTPATSNTLLQQQTSQPTTAPKQNNNSLQQDGQCTPPDLWVEQGFTDATTRKYTTGRYFKTDQPFGKSMLAVMQSEGMTCAQDPGNPSSITCYGFMQSANKDIDVRQLTLSSAEDRTYRKYYNDLGISKLPDNIKGDVMHVAFWRGPAKAVPTLCDVLGKPCPKQGSISDDIAQAAQNYTGDLHDKYWDKTWDELRANNPQSLWKNFSKRVNNARNNGCHVQPRHPVQI